MLALILYQVFNKISAEMGLNKSHFHFFFRFFLNILLLIILSTCGEGSGTGEVLFEVREVEGEPYLWEYGMPYFSRFQETDHLMLDLSGTWRFKPDPEDKGRQERWWGSGYDDSSWFAHPVPGVWNVQKPEWLDYTGPGWYRRVFFVPELFQGRFNRLVIEGICFHAEVWINGKFLGQHNGGYTEFSLDISRQLNYGGKNVLSIRVDNVLGMKDVPPRTWIGGRLGWLEYAGIHRGIRIESSPEATVFKLAVQALPDKDGLGDFFAKVFVFNHSPSIQDVRIALIIQDETGRRPLKLFPPQRKKLPGGAVGLFSFSGRVFGIKPWSPAHPGNLYNLVVGLSSDSGAEEQSFQIGFRRVEVKGTWLLLNDLAYYIRGINRHEDDPATGLYEQDDLIKQDMEMLKELGVNHVRPAHHPSDPRFLDACDRVGITLTEEIPLYQASLGLYKWFDAKFLKHRDDLPWADWGDRGMLSQINDPDLIENATQQLIEMIEHDRNHPSIIMWSLGNENMSFLPRSRIIFEHLYQTARRFDPDRPVTFAIITFPLLSPALERTADIGDLIMVNEYIGWYIGEVDDLRAYLEKLHARYPDKAILISEFGAGAEPGRHDEKVLPEKFSEEFQAHLLKATWEVILEKPYVIGGMPWCFADFRCAQWDESHPVPLMNLKGVVDYNRKKKLAFDTLKEIYQDIAER
jgi:beta-glucuronidase